MKNNTSFPGLSLVVKAILLFLLILVAFIMAFPGMYQYVPGWMILLSGAALFAFAFGVDANRLLRESKPPRWLTVLVAVVFLGMLVIETAGTLRAGVSLLEVDLHVRLIWVVLLIAVIDRVFWSLVQDIRNP